jgi:hypothetical protein
MLSIRNRTRIPLLTHFLLLFSAPFAVQGTPGYWDRRGRGFSSRLITAPNHRKSGSGHPSKQWGRHQSVKDEGKIAHATNVVDRSDYSVARVVRGGDNLDATRDNPLDNTVSVALKVLTTGCRTILPLVVATVRAVTTFYAALPVDAILAQVGLVYCFAGGYYPTLFAAVQAAQHCGWEVMVDAVDDLAEEAVAAIQACDFQFSRGAEPKKAHEIFTEKTKIVLATIDPMKINEAVAALYTTWMGVSTVLEKEFAETIALSITIADYIRPVINFVLAPPVSRCIPPEYHKWVPIVLGWACKAAAMSFAWRIQRVLTAYTSAIAGGLMFSRSIFRMLRKRGIRLFGLIPEDSDKSYLDEIVGFTVAAFGLYSQIGDGFDFDIPFPLSLVTWPFGLAERWIQWQITNKVE